MTPRKTTQVTFLQLAALAHQSARTWARWANNQDNSPEMRLLGHFQARLFHLSGDYFEAMDAGRVLTTPGPPLAIFETVHLSPNLQVKNPGGDTPP